MGNKLNGQFRALKGSILHKSIVNFLEEKYNVKIDLMEASFWVIGDYNQMKNISLDSCSTREERKGD